MLSLHRALLYSHLFVLLKVFLNIVYETLLMNGTAVSSKSSL